MIHRTSLILQLVLLLWSFGFIYGYPLGRKYLVEGEGWSSAAGLVFLWFLAAIPISWFFPGFGRWHMLVLLGLWLGVQFFCHWYFTIFGASPRKIRSYNQYFSNTWHLIEERETRVIPDLYHMVLHLLLAVNIVLVIIDLVKNP